MEKITQKILLFLIVFWIFLAIFGIFYNTGKTVTEVKAWAFLSDNEKREKIFGDLNNYFIFIGNNTQKNVQILIYANDVKTFYLSKYYLYPRIVYGTDNKQEFLQKVQTGNYPYVASYNLKFSDNHYKLVATDLEKKSIVFYLYSKYE